MPRLHGCNLTYFNTPGRGETIRLALTIGAIAFTDHRIPESPLAATPFGSVPILMLADGTRLTQQRSILRFIGKETGLLPSDALQAYRVDELMDTVEDAFVKVSAAGLGKLEQGEQIAFEAARLWEVVAGSAAALLASIDAHIAAHGTGGFAVGNSLTIADVHLFTTTGMLTSGLLDGVPVTILDRFDHILACRRHVANHPAVKNWYNVEAFKGRLAPESFRAGPFVTRDEL